MRLAFVEPFYGGSHRQWIEEIGRRIDGDVFVFSMPAKHWKWRMHGAAHTLAEEINRSDCFDGIVVSDMLDLAVFKGLLAKQHRETPVGIYFHENQLSYPFSETDTDHLKQRDNHYGWINVSSAFAADRVWFNSEFHMDDFLKNAKRLIHQMPDAQLSAQYQALIDKSSVLYVGVTPVKGKIKRAPKPTILWNHRWDYDKNPKGFFDSLYQLEEEGVDFNLIVCGEEKPNKPEFDRAKDKLANRIIHWGFVKSRTEYEELLLQSDVALVTSNQEFFGVSCIEAVLAGCYPIFPDRLSFSEHLAAHPECLYRNMAEMMHLLRITLNERPSFDNQYFERYIWDNLWPAYERALGDLLT